MISAKGLCLSVLVLMASSASFASSHSLAVECSTAGIENRIELSGTLKLQAQADGKFQVVNSSFIYLLKQGQENQKLSIKSAQVSVGADKTIAQIQFEEDLAANLNIAHDWDHQAQAGEVRSGSDKVTMNCTPKEINKNGFSLKGLLEMPFAD